MLLNGILLALLTGALWSLVGVFYNMIAKWKLSVFNISIVTSCISMAVFLTCVTKTGALLSGEIAAPGWNFTVFVVLAGFINMAGSLFLQRSMVHGKSAVTWAIGQSALVIPFVAMTLIYSESWSWTKIGGTAAVLVGMAVLGCRPGKSGAEAPNPKRGIAYALIAFAVLGIAQSMTAATGHFAYHDAGNVRAPLMTAGSFLAILCGKACLRDRGFRIDRKALLLIVLIALEGVVAMWLSFLAIDVLSEIKMGGIMYPVAVGMCIAGYSVFSMTFFHEKPNRFAVGGTLAILIGILIYCAAALI